MKFRVSSGFVLLLTVCISCGGKSAVEGSAPQASAGTSANFAGSTASGGASNGGATATNGGTESGGAGTAGATAVSTSCPAETPVGGTSCNYLGYQCNYTVDMCSSVGFLCQNGVWHEQPHSDGAALTCFNYAEPSVRPKDGDSCACRGMLDCTFDGCGAQGTSQAENTVHAVCDNSAWHVTNTPCTDAPCGPNGLLCAVGEVCVVRGGPLEADYRCVADPCAAQAQTLSCECASSVCHAPSERCTLNSGQIDCVCDTC